MNLDNSKLLLYCVTDRNWLNGDSLDSQVEKAILGGGTMIQLREKNLEYDEFLQSGKNVKRITDKYKVPFIINDNIDVALELDADGVHIGQSDENLIQARKKLGWNKIIGVSAHSVLEAIQAEENGADYIGVGAIFHTDTKQDAGNISFETLKGICNIVNIPVVAIGGITKDNIMKLSGSGVGGVAVISAIFGEEDISKAAKEMYLLSSKMVSEKA